MRQLTCIEPGKLAWRDVAEPTLDSDHAALVRPLAVARCDIDLPLSTGGFPLKGPFAVGHECVGEIAALGGAVRGLTVGQRVVVAFQVSCGQCARCTRGHSALCSELPVLSDYGMQPLSGVEYGGMLSDLIRVPYAEAMLQPTPEGSTPSDLASVSDNVLDGYRAVAPHIAALPGAEVLIVGHGALRSIPFYALLAARALGASTVDFASDDPATLRTAESLGARPIATDFKKPPHTYPIVVDAGVTAAGLRYAIRATEPEGTCQSVSYHNGQDVPLPIGRMYTLGIRFLVGRCHAASLLPEVMPLIAKGELAPERVTSHVAAWDDAAEAWLEPGVKLVVVRDEVSAC